MDEVDGMSTGDKGGVTTLTKIINPFKGNRSIRRVNKENLERRWVVPIICIVNNYNCKKINELKKECMSIKFEPPNFIDLHKLAQHIFSIEKMVIPAEILELIVKHGQSDLRRLLYVSQEFFLYFNGPGHLLNLKNAHEFLDTFEKKNIDTGLYDATLKLFQDNINMSQALELYDVDKSMTPLMIQENYVRVIDSHKIQTVDNRLCELQTLADITESISTGDIVNRYIYTNQGWSLQTIYGIYAVAFPCMYLKNNLAEQLDTTDLKFTSALGKMSIVSSRDGVISDLQLKVCTKGASGDLDYLNFFKNKIVDMLTDDDTEPKIRGLRLLELYNLSLDDVDNFLKICNYSCIIDDKNSNDSRKKFTTKLRSTLKKLQGELDKERKINLYANSKSTNNNNNSMNFTPRFKKQISIYSSDFD